MASRIFSVASASVEPCDQQPGKPGTQALKPSSVLRNAILYFIGALPSDYTPMVLLLSNGRALKLRTKWVRAQGARRARSLGDGNRSTAMASPPRSPAPSAG